MSEYELYLETCRSKGYLNCWELNAAIKSGAILVHANGDKYDGKPYPAHTR